MKTKKLSIALAGIMSAVAIASAVPMGTGATFGSVATVAHAETTTVTWSSSAGNFNTGGVSVDTDYGYDGYEWSFAYYKRSGTFTTSLGNFTKIEIAGGETDGFKGTGWSSRTWTGKASSVAFNGQMTDQSGHKPFTITFTIELPTVDVTGVNLNKSETTLTVDDSETLTATVAPANATDKTVTWTSSNTNVATVDNNGKVTAVGAGEATITATATNGTAATNDDKTATCKVTVKKNATATYAQEGEDFTSETETDNIASLWSIEVTPGTDAITTLGVKVKDNGGTFHGTDEVYNTPAISEGTIVAGIVVNHAAADVSGITAVVNGKDIAAVAAEQGGNLK